MSRDKMTPRQSLRAAIDRCCIARGEAQWLNGYRAGSGRGEDAELYAKESRLWKYTGDCERALEGYISRYATAVSRRRPR
jgi:hypothetical protein